VILGSLSMVLYLGVLAYAATRRLELAPVVGIVGGTGALLLLFLLLRRAEDVLAWTLLLLGAVYVLTMVVHHRHSVDEAAPLVAAALLLCGELAVWSCSERREIRVERRVVWVRTLAVAMLVVAGLGISALVLAVSAAPLGGGFAWTLLGALAAVGVVALAVRMSR
jgi:hypothetical protein